MKKVNLVLGLALTLTGFIFLSITIWSEIKLDGLLFGGSGACIGLGLVMTYKYMYWNSPKNKEKFQDLVENEKIERQDELKEKIRGKSAQYTYAFGLYAISFSVVLFAVLESIGIIENSFIFIYYLTGLMILQILVGWATFHFLQKKY